MTTAIRMQDGRILLPAGATITDIYVRRLKGFGITSVYIVDELFDEIEVRPCISDETKTKALNTVSLMYKQVASGKGFDDMALKNISKEITYEIKSSLTEPINLFNMYAIDDPRCLHAVNVACIVAAIALERKCNYIDTEAYTAAALLHDIMLEAMTGDHDISHAGEAGEMLKKTHSFSGRVYMGVAMHHEKYDGAGGPRKLANEAINEGARMIAIADTYDNLIYGHACKRMGLNYAVEYLNAQAGKSLDPQLVRLFNNVVAIYPTGSTVILNNGYKAVVIGQNKEMPARPKVRLAMHKREECLQFNLLTQKTMFISKVDL